MGVSRSENDKDIRRKEFTSYLTTVMHTVVERAMTMLDPAADQVCIHKLCSVWKAKLGNPLFVNNKTNIILFFPLDCQEFLIVKTSSSHH